MENRYVGIVRKEPDSCYGVEFADFPGCVSAGDTPEEAQDNAREALALHIEGLLEDREAKRRGTTRSGLIQDLVRKVVGT